MKELFEDQFNTYVDNILYSCRASQRGNRALHIGGVEFTVHQCGTEDVL